MTEPPQLRNRSRSHLSPEARRNSTTARIRDGDLDVTAHEPDTAETAGWNLGLLRRSREIRLALGCLVIGVSVVGLTVFWARAVTGGGLDIGAHYLITNWIMEHWNLPSTDPALQGFSDYHR